MDADRDTGATASGATHHRQGSELERDQLIKNLLPVAQALRLYHRHSVVGIDSVPAAGPALIVSNHSLATYDIVLLMTAIYSEFTRMPRPLIDRLFFKVPGLGELMTLAGAVQGSQTAGRELLEGGEIVTVAPGGMHEALRPSSQRYQIRWERRLGFARLAAETGTPVILAACPKADDLYEVFPSPLTRWAYSTFKVPLFFARGVGPTPLPRPVRLVHHLSEPMVPPRLGSDPDEREQAIGAFHARLIDRMRSLISEAIHSY